jgi:hypothetical protein
MRLGAYRVREGRRLGFRYTLRLWLVELSFRWRAKQERLRDGRGRRRRQAKAVVL